ncbi:MAG: alginate lyase family protein [Candidatus Cryptobacteroides sp.]
MKHSVQFILIAAMAVSISTASCTDYLKHGVVDLTPVEKPEEPEEFEYPSSYTFNHPCALVSKADIERVKNQIALASASDPVYVAYTNFCKSPYAQSGYKANPVEIIIRGDATGIGEGKENYITISKDASAAYQLALRWKLTGESKYADDAVRILNDWADVCQMIKANDNNQYLCAGFQGYTLGNAAELLRDYEGWTAADQNDFKAWLRNVWVAKNEWFIDNHGGSGVCDLHYWSNWELANLASMLAIGTYLEDNALITKVYRNFREGKGSGCINNIVPFDPVADPDGHGMLAQSMESGRDQGHGTLVASMSAELCQMAWNLGLDFWGMNDNRMLAMFEYTAKFNVMPNGTYICTSMPFKHYSYCAPGCGCSGNHGAEHEVVSSDGRGTIRPCWDLIYSHYKHVAKVSDDDVYYAKLFADQLRYTDGVLTGDGGSGDSRYGSNSSAFDQIGWGTMMYYLGE